MRVWGPGGRLDRWLTQTFVRWMLLHSTFCQWQADNALLRASRNTRRSRELNEMAQRFLRKIERDGDG